MKKRLLTSPVSLLLAITIVLAGNFAFAADDEKKLEATREFAGINFGVGLTLTIDVGVHDRVENAEVVNGVVRVTEEYNDIPRIMLETHYFFLPKHYFLGMDSVKPNEWGIGPFVGIQNGSNEIIEAIGGGVMLGFRRSEMTKDSFNIGVGFVVDPSAKVLGDGIEENKPLPAGETQVRYKKTSQGGILLITSYAF
jgi:hypothetical protein